MCRCFDMVFKSSCRLTSDVLSRTGSFGAAPWMFTRSIYTTGMKIKGANTKETHTSLINRYSLIGIFLSQYAE